MSNQKGFTLMTEYFTCKLKKAPYGLKKAPRACNKRIDSCLTKLGHSKNDVDPNIYFKVDGDDMIILILYVDDLLIIGEKYLIKKWKQELKSNFDMKDLGFLHYLLGLEV